MTSLLLELVFVTWAASTGGPTGYKVHIGTSPGNYSQHIDVGNVLTYEWDLDISSPKYVVVTAYNDFGDSPNSSQITMGKPSAPVITATGVSE